MLIQRHNLATIIISHYFILTRKLKIPSLFLQNAENSASKSCLIFLEEFDFVWKVYPVVPATSNTLKIDVYSTSMQSHNIYSYIDQTKRKSVNISDNKKFYTHLNLIHILFKYY